MSSLKTEGRMMSVDDWRDKNIQQVDDDLDKDPSLIDPNLEGYRKNVPDHTWDEEFSADMTYDGAQYEQDVDTKDRNEQSYQITGWIAVILSIASFFIMPIIMAAAGIILGVISRTKRARTLGNTAIVISIISFAYFLFIRPMIF